MKLLLILFFSLLSTITAAQQCQEGEERACGYPDTGICTPGKQLCTNSQWSQCYGGKGPEQEQCFNNLDDDCDGQTDENCVCIEGEERACGPETTEGICEQGLQTCHDNEWSPCEGEIYPLFGDICGNEKDDDCDGNIDEGCTTTTPQDNTCFNNLQDAEEQGVDCGGPCATCPTCMDGIKNQQETAASQHLGNGTISDCGGPHCPACPTCFDKTKNQQETDIDCGGPCISCQQPINDDYDHDGLTQQQELLKGTNPLLADTDGDSIQDNKDLYPLCPNNTCDESYGETKKTCPEDCRTPATTLITSIITLAFLALAFFAYKVATKKTSRHTPTTRQREDFNPQLYNQYEEQKNKTTTKKDKLEQQLQQSFQKIDKYLKK